MSSFPEVTVTLDVKGEACPMPLLKAKMKLNQMKEGETLKVIATDAGSVRDFSAFIALTPHRLLQEPMQGETFVYYITKDVGG